MRETGRLNKRIGQAALLAACTVTLLFCTLSMAPTARADASNASTDPHYTPAGFFDMHVCNWPDRSMFFMALFSTERFRDIKSIDVFRPDGRPLVSLDLTRYRVLKPENKPEKHVFISETDLPADAADGWYRAQISFEDGQIHHARDYVVIKPMGIVDGITPSQGERDIAIPAQMTWSPVADATYYRVYITDKWDDSKVIYESKLLKEPRLQLPQGLIKPDGFYTWRVQARDVDGDKRLGDFNHGSLSAEFSFTTAPQGDDSAKPAIAKSAASP